MEHMKGERMRYIFLFWNFDHKISRSEAPTVRLGTTSVRRRRDRRRLRVKPQRSQKEVLVTWKKQWLPICWTNKVVLVRCSSQNEMSFQLMEILRFFEIISCSDVCIDLSISRSFLAWVAGWKLQDELRHSGLQGFHGHPQNVKLAQLPFTQVQRQREQCLLRERKNGDHLTSRENLIHKAKIKC